MKMDDLRKAVNVYRKLVKISKSLHGLDEAACSYILTKRQETRENNLEKRAEELAKELGLKIYHQRDPRGCPLYLVDGITENTNYNNGIAIY